MEKIRLGNKELFAIVDESDYKKISRYRWHLSICGAAQRRPRRPDGTRGTIFIHQQLLGVAGKGRRVVHINGNRLDCRRENLQLSRK